ncbi:hydrogenase [candidate division BRC1 bacterium HGW-BRC1-1]|nr:MAG: hydrogenase [candidate division BRC1 bacterium HGW-BRC1-1]
MSLSPEQVAEQRAIGNDRENAPVMAPGYTMESVTETIAGIPLSKNIRMGWAVGFLIAFGGMNLLLLSIVWLLYRGVGIWGINSPVGWGFAIINFVWWVGIGHAGTLISAILLLLRQQWRMSINRFAEAMTIFAVSCAGLFPLLHTGRPWMAYYLFPYPSTSGMWPQFRSPLVWDVFAVSTYATVSIVFWYVGLVPDLGTMRDRAKNKLVKFLTGMLALGWRGSARHWHRYEMASLLLAGLATPLVVSVHTVVSYDFAVGLIPGWHVTLFPPYFVAGAIFSGFAMVITLAIPIRWYFGLEGLVTLRHMENMAKVLLATGMCVAYGYSMEVFFGWYSASRYEEYLVFNNRMLGPYGWSYWMLILCNVISVQVLWFRWVRTNMFALFILSIIINVGMWLERFVIVITSLHADYLPSSWGMYYPTFWDIAMFIGTIGFFLTSMFLFVRAVPMISIFELRTLLPQARVKEVEK